MQTQKIRAYDVIVVGGGAGGVSAAVAAGRAGAKTLLIEREGCLGGGATTMLVNPFMPYTTSQGPQGEASKIVNGGFFLEVLDRLKARGATSQKDDRRFDDEAMKVVLDELVTEAGVEVLFHAALFDATAKDGQIKSIRLAHNGGPIQVFGKVFVDSTGDALLAALCGAEILYGDSKGQVMPMTLNFAVAGVDTNSLPSLPEMRALADQGGQDDPPLVNTNLSCWSSSYLPGVVHFNAIRVSGNTIDPTDLSHAEMEARRRVQNFVAWIKAIMPAFADCFLIKTANHIGIRESRRVLGDYLLTEDDFFKGLHAAVRKGQRRSPRAAYAGKNFHRCARFDDAIACCSYCIDIHGHEQGEVRIVQLPPGEYYQIPYRCLTPKGLTNLLMASRSVSADVVMHSSLRIMPPVMNIGQAAGLAAAMALPQGNVRSINVRQLQDKICASGGILEPQ